jgi:hypothetical protein
MLVVDTENIVSSLESAPDRLRAQIAGYYDEDMNNITYAQDQFDNEIETLATNEQVLIPVKKNRIHLKGKESRFRDHTQWNEFINQTISTGRQFLDHTFDFTPPTVTNSFHKNFHHPQYEDATKTFPSNQLLNFNLISYPHKDKVEKVRNIGELRTEFDLTDPSINRLFDEFSNRIANYTGSVGEIATKQRNIIDFEPRDYSSLTDYPYRFQKHSDAIITSFSGFSKTLFDYKKYKHLFQMLKKDLSFSNRSFTIGQDQISGKIYNAINLLTSTSINRFTEASDELFLLRENDVNHSDPSERFVNQINSVRFLSEMRTTIDQASRSLEEIYGSQTCKTSLIGYKIEKYLDNDATNPIQTYYTTNNNFVDTQLKHGRRYIYKTKVLLGIFGSSYSYSNLVVAQSEAEPTTSPSPYMGEKYWAHVDVDVVPSFQILEYEIDRHEAAFVDFPTLPPHVEFYNRKDEGLLQMYFRPRFFSMSNAQGEPMLAAVGNLRPSDANIAELSALSGEQIANPDYFTGIYEIYRMENPPQRKEDFSNYYLTTVDDQTGIIRPTQNMAAEVFDNMNGYFADRIIPNQKYYYAFRALTYHGTPSELTHPFEIELQRDSDEYKISVKEYHYPQEKDYSFQKNAKRLIRIVPNIERLLFSEETDKNTWQLDEGNLVSKGAGPNDNKTFKIRVTSKHTGKKMDINVTFKLKKDDSFTNQPQN